MGCTARSEMKVSCNFHMLINPYVNKTFKYAFYKKGTHWLVFFRSYLGTLALNTNALNISYNTGGKQHNYKQSKNINRILQLSSTCRNSTQLLYENEINTEEKAF